MNADLPIVFFNNCVERPHSTIYERDAFFDLGTDGVQGRQATDLRPGQLCIVAASPEEGRVVFDWYSFRREVPYLNEDGSDARVFVGKHLKSESMTKSKAAAHRVYSVFFNCNGHFKRQSTLRQRNSGRRRS